MLRLIVILIFVPALSATVIVQKNGDVISGRILQERPDRYVFQSPYGKLQIAKSNVSKLILDEKQIQLQDVKYKNKTVQARLVAQDNKTSVYLTDDGRTIRTESEQKPVAPDEKRDKFLFSLSGGYGWANFQQVADAQNGGVPAPFDQTFRPGTFGFLFSGHYGLSRFFAAGVNAAFYRWSGSVNVAQSGTPPDFEAASVHGSFFVSPSIAVSLLGNLGSHSSSHDIRVEVQPGYSLNSAAMKLTFAAPLNGFPGEASAGGKTGAFALQAQLYYAYSLTESLRLRFGGAYYRIFYDRIFDGTLQNGTAIPGGFTTDFEKNLNSTAQNPQIVSITLGAELGF
jgi:hypothetical protein